MTQHPLRAMGATLLLAMLIIGTAAAQVTAPRRPLTLRLDIPISWQSQSGSIPPDGSGLCCTTLDAAHIDLRVGLAAGADLWLLTLRPAGMRLGLSLDVAWAPMSHEAGGREAPRRIYDNGGITELWERNSISFTRNELRITPALAAHLPATLWSRRSWAPDVVLTAGPEFALGAVPDARHEIRIEQPADVTYGDGSRRIALQDIELEHWNALRMGIALDLRCAWPLGRVVPSLAHLPLAIHAGAGWTVGISDAVEGGSLRVAALRLRVGIAWEVQP